MSILAKWAKELAINIAKYGVSEGMKVTLQQKGKKIMYIILGIAVVFIIIVAAVNALLSAFLCNDFIGLFEGDKATVSCPKPPINEDKLGNLAKELEEERAKEWNKMEDQNQNQKFRAFSDFIDENGGIDAVKEKIGEEKADEISDLYVWSEAGSYLRVMAQMDLNTFLLYVDTEDFDEGGALDGSVIEKNYTQAYEAYTHRWNEWFRKKENKERRYSENLAHYLSTYRLDVYNCFLVNGETTLQKLTPFTGSVCDDDDIIDSMGTDKYQGIALTTKDGDFTNPQIRKLLDTFYEISFIKYLDGKVPQVPKGESKKMFDEMLTKQLETLNKMYPEQVPTSTAFAGSGWLKPMIDGTYNFASPLGMRTFNGSTDMHNGVDMGTLSNYYVPIFATKGGTVIASGWQTGGYGGIVTIDHGDGFYSMYAHMRLDDILVKVGDTVQQGQLIGSAGGEPNLAIHLHFEICKQVAADGSGNQICTGTRENPEDEQFGLNLRTPAQNMSKTKEYANKLKNEWRDKAKKGEVIIMPGFTGGIGSISAKEESNLDPAICVHNAWDVAGGLSCGTHQIANGPGTMKEFMDFLKDHYPDYYKEVGTVERTLEALGPKWEALSRKDPGFMAAQHAYIAESHYMPQVRQIKKLYGADVTTMHRAIQEMVWSAGVRERAGTVSEWGNSIGKNWSKMSDAEMVNAFYDERQRRAPSLTPRWNRERKAVLDLL